MDKRIIISGLATIAAAVVANSANAQSTRSMRPVVLQPPVGEVVAPVPLINRRSGAPVDSPPAVVQVQPGVIMKRVYPAYVCSVGVLSSSEKAKNPGLKPTIYTVEFLPIGDGLYHSNGQVLAFNQFSFRMLENAGVIEFKVDAFRADYVKAHGEILASWVLPVKWTLATDQIEGTYTQYWFATGVSGTCRTK